MNQPSSTILEDGVNVDDARVSLALCLSASASMQQKLRRSEWDLGPIESAAPLAPRRMSQRTLKSVTSCIRSTGRGTSNHAPQGRIARIRQFVTRRSSPRPLPFPFAQTCTPSRSSRNLASCMAQTLLANRNSLTTRQPYEDREDPMVCIMQECFPTVPAPSSPEPLRPCWQSQCRLQSFCIMVPWLVSGQ
jgi:hypothetical protein